MGKLDENKYSVGGLNTFWISHLDYLFYKFHHGHNPLGLIVLQTFGNKKHLFNSQEIEVLESLIISEDNDNLLIAQQIIDNKHESE